MDTLSEHLRRSKGPGNFRNLVGHMSNGKPDGLKQILVSEVVEKDDFSVIKNASMTAVLAIPRVQLGLLSSPQTILVTLGNEDQALSVFMQIVHAAAVAFRGFQRLGR